MFAAYVIVTIVTIAANAFSGIAAILHFKPILPGMARAGVPESWLTFPIGTLKTAGAAGLRASTARYSACTRRLGRSWGTCCRGSANGKLFPSLRVRFLVIFILSQRAYDVILSGEPQHLLGQDRRSVEGKDAVPDPVPRAGRFRQIEGDEGAALNVVRGQPHLVVVLTRIQDSLAAQ